jgi:hypothetical protein
MKKSSVSEGRERFKDGRENVGEDERSDRPNLTGSMKIFKKCGIWRI